MTREEEIFEEVLLLPPAQRMTRVATLAAGDMLVSQRVLALLQAHDQAENFLEAPAAGVTRGSTVPDPDDMIGRRIGHYKLLQKIGEGGCGVVFMAEQDEPVRRRVALKVIKLGMDTKAVIARFEAERQALSMMDHPHIARVLDVGATEQGRPFFVMELVRGIPITRYADEHHLSTPQRLALFLDVCGAVQHAHQKGVIHRDLKPSNILVTLHDGVPVPKVIDFGVAKATHGRLTNQTLFTAFEQFIGTPAYMSPEQAELSGLDIDTRSDIYSLGVLLYELLSGRPPFDPKTFSTAGLDEIRRVIREVEPPTPSSRLGTLTDADRATIARARGTAPAHLASVLRGDLDWIVMKALEKNRTRRYDTANGLAMDLRRFLGNEPVMARPPSTAYLLQKLIRRHRLAFAAAAIVLLSLVASLTAVVARLSAEKDLRKAAAELNDTNQQSLEIQGRVAASTENLELAKFVYNQAESNIRGLAGQPAAQVKTLETAGRVAFNVGDLVRAQEFYARALKLHGPATGGSQLDYARALNHRALVASAIVTQARSRQMQLDPSAPLKRDDVQLKTAEEDLRAAIAVQSAIASARTDFARSMSNLGWVLSQQGRQAEAEKVLQEAIAIQAGLPGKLDLALSYRRIGLIQIHQNRIEEALASLQLALQSDRDAFQGIEHVEVASDFNFRAVAFAIRDRNTDLYIVDAIESYYDAIDIREKLKSETSFGEPEADAASANLSRQGTIEEVTSLVAEARAFAVERMAPSDKWTESFFMAIPAFVFIAEEQYDHAVNFAQRCYNMRLAQNPDDWRTYNAESMLGQALLGQRKPDQLVKAGGHLRHAYEAFKGARDLPPEHRIWVGLSIANMMVFDAATGSSAEAMTMLGELKAWESTVSPRVAAVVARLKAVKSVREQLERAMNGAR